MNRYMILINYIGITGEFGSGWYSPLTQVTSERLALTQPASKVEISNIYTMVII